MSKPDSRAVQASLSSGVSTVGDASSLASSALASQAKSELIPPPADFEQYRPISGWAIAGLVLAVLSGFCWMDSPLLIPALAWWLPGFLTSGWAWLTVHRRQNTLAGITLARIGLAISLVNGLGSLTAQEVTYWIVRAEAKRFALELLDYIHQRKERELFLATLPPDQRRHKEPPADRNQLIRYFEAQSRSGNPVVAFETSPAGQLVLREAPNRQNWEFRGVAGYEVLSDVSNPGYRFRFLYRVRRDLEPEDGQPRLYDVELVLTCLRVNTTRSRWRVQREWFWDATQTSIRPATE